MNIPAAEKLLVNNPDNVGLGWVLGSNSATRIFKEVSCEHSGAKVIT